MIIEITGRHLSVTDDLKKRAATRLEHVLRHVGTDIVSAHVILDSEKARQMAEMVVHGRNLTAAVHAEADDLHVAIDRAAEKLRHQLERHHARRRDARKKSGRHRVKPAEAALAAELAAQADLAEREERARAGRKAARAASRAAAPARTREPATNIPRVNRVGPAPLPILSVADAVRRLGRDGGGILLFREESGGRPVVLHRSAAGDLTLHEIEAS